MAENQEIDPLADDELSPDELVCLFSALEDVRADDELKSAAIARMLEAVGTMADAADDVLSATDGSVTEASVAPETAGGGAAGGADPRIVAAATMRGAGAKSPNARKPRTQKIRVIRILAIAACLALALTGGAAYAIPSAHVQVSNSTSSIDVGINRFGIAVSAESDDEELNGLIQTEGINGPADEALGKAYELLEGTDPGKPISLNVESSDPGQRDHLESKGREIAEQHRAKEPDGQAFSPSAPAQDPVPASPDAEPGAASGAAAPQPGAPSAPNNEEAPEPDASGNDGARDPGTHEPSDQHGDGEDELGQDREPDAPHDSEASFGGNPPQGEPARSGPGAPAPK